MRNAARLAARDRALVSVEEIIMARKGRANEPRRDAAVQFARKVIEARGNVTDADTDISTASTWRVAAGDPEPRRA